MADPFTDVAVAGKLMGFLAKAAVPLAIAAGGLATGVAYEHKAPWALGPTLDRLRASLPARDAGQRDIGAKAQFDHDLPKYRAVAGALGECRTGRDIIAHQAGQDIAGERTAASDQFRAAYQMGRQSCGASHASTPSPAGGVGAGGVRSQPADFRDVFAGAAFRVGGGHPVPASGAQPAAR